MVKEYPVVELATIQPVVPVAPPDGLVTKATFEASIKTGWRDFSGREFKDEEMISVKTHASGLNLFGAIVKRVYFSFINLHAANLRVASFEKVNFFRVDLRRAQVNAQLQMATLEDVKLTPEQVLALHGEGMTDFRGVNLTDADLSGHNFSSVPTGGIQISTAQFLQLYHAGKRDFSGVCFKDLTLPEGFDLSNCNFEGANFRALHFNKVIVHGCNFKDCRFIHASCIINSVDFSEADIDTELLRATCQNIRLSEEMMKASLNIHPPCSLWLDYTGKALLDVNLVGLEFSVDQVSQLYAAGRRNFRGIQSKADLFAFELEHFDADFLYCFTVGDSLSGEQFLQLYQQGLRRLISLRFSHLDLSVLADISGIDFSGDGLHAAPKLKCQSLTCTWEQYGELKDVDIEGELRLPMLDDRLLGDDFKLSIFEEHRNLAYHVDLFRDLASINRALFLSEHPLGGKKKLEIQDEQTAFIAFKVWLRVIAHIKRNPMSRVAIAYQLLKKYHAAGIHGENSALCLDILRESLSRSHPASYTTLPGGERFWKPASLPAELPDGPAPEGSDLQRVQNSLLSL